MPRFAQPFDLQEAIRLEPAEIAAGTFQTRTCVVTPIKNGEEIARLEHSIQRLNATQDELKEALKEGSDEEYERALAENADTMFVTFLLCLRWRCQ